MNFCSDCRAKIAYIPMAYTTKELSAIVAAASQVIALAKELNQSNPAKAERFHDLASSSVLVLARTLEAFPETVRTKMVAEMKQGFAIEIDGGCMCQEERRLHS